jgi:ABC-type sugar transport system ATPase subunit
MSDSLLRMRGITKSFPGVRALEGVDFDVRPGEIHALVGENGAGKSTLMHILAGVQRPDAGTIDLAGQSNVVIADQHTSQRLGIAIVYQERSLFGPLSIAENIFAGRQPVRRFGHVDRAVMLARSRSLLTEVGLNLDPRTIIEELSATQQQLVEIAKALSLDARLFIFDEPTAALTLAETAHLFGLVGRLKSAGRGVIYISHRLDEVFRLADRVTVLKDGRHQGTFAADEITPRRLVALMVGRELLEVDSAIGHAAPGDAMLEVHGLRDARPGGSTGLAVLDVSFTARRGEIVALAGLAGAGRSETALALFGARHPNFGDIRLDGRSYAPNSPREAIAAGVGYLPEDRKEAGLFLDLTIAQNIAAARLDKFGQAWQNDARRDAVAGEYCASLKIAARGVGQEVATLSGGSQQKVLLAKWLLCRPKVLLVDEPTRGVDVGAKADVHRFLRDLARQGTAVVLISSDLPEVLALADRIVVLRQGRVAGELPRAAATEEKVVSLATACSPSTSLAS